LIESSSASVKTPISKFVCSMWLLELIIVVLLFAREGHPLNPWSKEYPTAFLAAVLHVTQKSRFKFRPPPLSKQALLAKAGQHQRRGWQDAAGLLDQRLPRLRAGSDRL
jgi:hypothetical protein